MGEDMIPTLGPVRLGGDRWRFLVWAPLAREVALHLLEPAERVIGMEAGAGGYHHVTVDALPPGATYLYRLEGVGEFPDPASRSQPRGIHGPSQTVDPEFPWEDGSWSGLPLEDYVIYELHVGTFTREGTFAAVLPHLGDLRDMGVTALELMPVAQFPGGRNWGYDGAFPYAVQDTYGGPGGLRGLVGACHREGLAVVLDVVYNHLGPEGNHLARFAPYFTDRYRTPWGEAINFDGPESDEVRRFFIENAFHWFGDYHIDALRLDALHAIMDASARPFLADLVASVDEFSRARGRRFHLMGESDANDVRLIMPQTSGGIGLDAVWNDDFHHALHVLLTGERSGYYLDFGLVGQLGKTLSEGFVLTGQHSDYRQRRHGTSTRDVPSTKLVVFAQNHDQVGNRPGGERLAHLVPFEGLKVAAALVLLSPYIPLLFMGEEYGERAPFYYFVSHGDPALVEAVREGRREEFRTFGWEREPQDPQAEATFLASKLNHRLRGEGCHRLLVAFYTALLRLRRHNPALANLRKEDLRVKVIEGAKALVVERWKGDERATLVANLGRTPSPVVLPPTRGRWVKELDSTEEAWGGPGSSLPGHWPGGDGGPLELPPLSCAVHLEERGV